MGRPRKTSYQGLPKRVYLRSGTFWFVHRDGRWQKLGRDLVKASEEARLLEAGKPIRGTMAYWLREWHKFIRIRVEKKTLAQRTYDDYVADSEPLIAYFGAMLPTDILRPHIAEYLELGLKNNRAVRANREKAALSSCMTWMISKGHGDLLVNVCRAVKRNPESARDRYIEDDEYHAVFDKCGPAKKAWAELIYRTLQRPSDILKWTRSCISESGGVKHLSFRQSKTGRSLKIGLTPQLEKLLEDSWKARKKQSNFLVAREDGHAYTESGLASMFRRACVAAGAKDFAPYDLKAKGASDMHAGGVPLETICDLCGHDSVTTTERYVRTRGRAVLTPNNREPVRPKKK